jgi:hypothetical protein
MTGHYRRCQHPTLPRGEPVSGGWVGRRAPGCARRASGSRATPGRSRPRLRRPGRFRSCQCQQQQRGAVLTQLGKGRVVRRRLRAIDRTSLRNVADSARSAPLDSHARRGECPQSGPTGGADPRATRRQSTSRGCPAWRAPPSRTPPSIHQREGRCRGHVQGRVRMSPADRMIGQHRRGSGMRFCGRTAPQRTVHWAARQCKRRSVSDRLSCPGPPGAHLLRQQQGGHDECCRERRPGSTRRSTTAGIDWASETSAVSVVSYQGIELERFTVEHTAAGLRRLPGRLTPASPRSGSNVPTGRSSIPCWPRV